MASALAAGKFKQVNTFEKHIAGIGLQNSADAVKKRAFSGAVVTQNARHRSHGHVKVDVFPEPAFTVGKAQSANLQQV